MSRSRSTGRTLNAVRPSPELKRVLKPAAADRGSACLRYNHSAGLRLLERQQREQIVRWERAGRHAT
jgi:hypothetical protein